MWWTFSGSFSLTTRMILITLLVGSGVWIVLDELQSHGLKQDFLDHHQPEFIRNSQLDRIQFDQYVRRFPELAELIATRQGMPEYLDELLQSGREQPIQRTQLPPWMPSKTLLRSFPTPRILLLLDDGLQVREVVNLTRGELPRALASPASLLVKLSHRQHYMTLLEGRPHLLASHQIFYHKGNQHATLLLATPVDDEFFSMLHSRQQITGSVVVLVDGQRERRIIASSMPGEIATGTHLDEYMESYASGNMENLDYGDSELLLQFGSLSPRHEMDHIMGEVYQKERLARLILGLSLIGSFMLVMVGLTRRIAAVNRKVKEFAFRELGELPEPMKTKDQLAILEELFVRLTRRVKTAHRTLLDKACELEAVVANVADGIIVIDEESYVSAINPAAQKIFLVDKTPPFPLESLMPPEMRLRHREGVKRLMETGQSTLLDRPIEVPGLREDGTIRQLDLRVSAMDWQDHRHYIGIVRDITERKSAETALMASELRFRTLVDLIPHGVEECDLDAVVTFSNPARHRMLERAQGELVGKTIFENASSPGEMERLKKYFQNLVAEQPPPFPYFEQNRTASGKMIDIQVDWTYKRDPQGRLTGFASIITDITEKKAAERRIREQQESLAHVQRLQTMGEIASGIAHELNQPLAAILNYARGCSRRLRSGSWDFQEILAVIDRIGEQAERVGLIMQNLRGFLSKGKANTSRVELTRVVRDAVEFMDYETRRHGVAVCFRTDEQDHPVVADTIQIQQVIQNLMRNAIEAMLESDKDLHVLEIDLYNSGGDQVTLTIRDSGPGIDPRLKSELFCPFFTTKADGMGLGLSISQSIIEHHGGRLWFDNRPEGGALFGITLPLGRRPIQ